MRTPPSLYVVVDARLAPGFAAAQAVHAAIQWFDTDSNTSRHWYDNSKNLVILESEDLEATLAALCEAAAAGGHQPPQAWSEPDLGYRLTAVAAGPWSKASLSNLPLLGKAHRAKAQELIEAARREGSNATELERIWCDSTGFREFISNMARAWERCYGLPRTSGLDLLAALGEDADEPKEPLVAVIRGNSGAGKTLFTRSVRDAVPDLKVWSGQLGQDTPPRGEHFDVVLYETHSNDLEAPAGAHEIVVQVAGDPFPRERGSRTFTWTGERLYADLLKSQAHAWVRHQVGRGRRS